MVKDKRRTGPTSTWLPPPCQLRVDRSTVTRRQVDRERSLLGRRQIRRQLFGVVADGAEFVSKKGAASSTIPNADIYSEAICGRFWHTAAKPLKSFETG